MTRPKPKSEHKKRGPKPNPNAVPLDAVTLRLPRPIVKRLRAEAKRRGESQASIVAKGIQKEIGK
jgi:hypothetical protein